MHDYKDVIVRATQDAKARNRSVYAIHEASSTELTPPSQK